MIIAIHPTNPNIVYVGTGEANNRQTSSFGDGIYKTTDGGKTFQHIGLRETQTIARVVIDPRNPDTVYVAAPGHLFGPNPERGIYKTTDGGRTWNNVKFIDNDTGFTDIAIDPSNPSILYAASYQRRRIGCCFNGGGPGSALWKSTDAGRSWTKIGGKGLPGGTYGRIALDVSRSNPTSSTRRSRRARSACRRRRRAVDTAGATEVDADGARRAAASAGDAAGTGRGTDAGGATAARVSPARSRSAPPRGAAGRRRPRRITTGATTAARAVGFGRGRGGGAQAEPPAAATDPAAARSEPRRRLPVRGQGGDLDAREQLQRAADVLQPAARGSDQRQDRSTSPVCPGRSHSMVDARSQHSTTPAETTPPVMSISMRCGSTRRTRSI